MKLRMIARRALPGLLVVGTAMITFLPVFASERFITLASTTSTENSGLFDAILPQFTIATGIGVRVVAVGTGAALRLDGLLAVYHIRRLSQVQLIYRAELLSEEISAGEESEEVGLFTAEDIPWRDLAFPSVRWALTQYATVKDKAAFAPFTNPDGETGDCKPGSTTGV